MSRPTEVVIDFAALQHNLACVRQRAPHSQIIAMVKSNAYGHGLVRIGKALKTVDAFGVACLEEALQLREAGVSSAIVLMEGLFQSEELEMAASHQLTLVIHELAQIDMLEKSSCPHPFTVWLKVDSGMHRLGLPARDVQPAWLRLMNCPRVKKPIGLMTHFAETEEPDSQGLQRQFELFNRITANLPGPRSLAKSGAILGSPATHLDWIRPGIILYGASPWPDDTGLVHGLKPVMTLQSRLIAIHSLAKNERVGYGGVFTCPEDMRIGVVAAGYGDGYPQGAINGTPVLVNGQVCPLAGRVSMDLLTVDLRSQPEARVGDPVVLWGKGLPVEEVARRAGSSGYELLTRMTRRVRVRELSPGTEESYSRGETHAIV